MLASQDLQFFIAISQAASLASAARALDVTPSAVSQRLRLMEQRLDVRLVERKARGLHLTHEGQVLAARAATLLAELQDLTESLAASRRKVAGRLRVAAPFGFGRRYVAPAMAALRTEEPEVTLELCLFEHPAGLRPDSFDVIVHIGVLQDSSLTMHRLAPNRRILCAAPTYIERCGVIDRVEDLARHVFGVIRENASDESLLRLSRNGGPPVTIRARPDLSSNDGEVIRNWGLAGLGLIVRSEWDVATDLAQGRLQPVLPEWRLPDADVVALTGPRAGRAARVVRFLELLRASLQPTPWRER